MNKKMKAKTNIKKTTKKTNQNINKDSKRYQNYSLNNKNINCWLLLSNSG